MTEALKLPVGIEDFAEIRQAGFYYVDKTKFIEQLLDGWGKVNLFTRPRRFGKTLNMDSCALTLKRATRIPPSTFGIRRSGLRPEVPGLSGQVPRDLPDLQGCEV